MHRLVEPHTQGFPTVAAPSRTQSGHTEVTDGKRPFQRPGSLDPARATGYTPACYRIDPPALPKAWAKYSASNRFW